MRIEGMGGLLSCPCGDAKLIQTPAAPVTPGQIPGDALVVLVDDESAILRGMAELFDNWRIDLVTAHSADEATQWLDSLGRVPDVIVTDYRLPDDTDGIYAFVERAFPRAPRRIRFEVTGYPLAQVQMRMQFHCGSL